MVKHDIRQAFRVWWRTPVLAATVTLTLALGVGANTAVFSVVHAVIFRPLPYPAADRLVELFEHNRTANTFLRASGPNYSSWAARSSSFEALAAFNAAAFNLSDGREPERVTGSLVTASLFRVLGVGPILGRPLTSDDERPGASRVALISESLWRRRFGAEQSVIGRSITLSGEPHEIVGVVPGAFREIGRAQASAPAPPEIIVPLTMDPGSGNRSNHVLRVVGRLRSSVSLEQARAEMHAIAAAMEQEFPASNREWGVRIDRVQDTMFETGVRTSLLVLFGAVGLVFLTTCANVANLLLARASGRQRELALRAVLGAERGRLVRQLVTESLCLALVGGICGLVAAFVCLGILRGFLPATLPRIDEVRLDAAVLAFGLLLSLASGLFFGVLPAIRATRVAPLPALMLGGRGIANTSRARVRQALLVAQMGLATMLLVAAALLLQSFVQLQNVPLGFQSERVVTARIGVPGGTPGQALAFYEELVRSLERLPQVEAVAIGTSAPFAPGVRRGLTVRDDVTRQPTQGIAAVEHIVSPDYFRALEMPLIAGTSFGRTHSLTSPPVAIVSQRLARQLWSTDDAVDRQLERDGRPHQVIGVVGDIRGADARGARGGGLDREPQAAVYLSASQSPQNTMTLLIRTADSPAALVPALRKTLFAIDPTVPMYQVRNLGDWLAEADAQPQLTTTLTAVFAMVALLLAVVGVYGVVSYSVEQRTAEMGVRMAVGATPVQVLLLMLRSGMAWAVAGIAIGLAAASLFSQVLANVLFEVPAHDPLTFAFAGSVLAIVALAACYMPARRASRIDALAALRSD